MVVGYGLSLFQLLDLDEKNQVLTTNVWAKYVRFNSRLPPFARRFTNNLIGFFNSSEDQFVADPLLPYSISLHHKSDLIRAIHRVSWKQTLVLLSIIRGGF